MWDVILDWIFDVIHFFYNFCGDWGLSIIIVTIIFRILVSPLMHKQAKSTYMMQKVQPQMAKIQERFAGDQLRQQQEMQKLYAEAKFNPLAGCLPMLLQMPIFIALFQVLRSMGERVGGDSSYEFYNLVPNLTLSPSQTFSMGFVEFLPYLILMIIFAGATFVPMWLNQRKSTDEKQKRTTTIMSVVMSIFMLWISWGSPAGVLLFWGVSSLIGIGQNQLSLYLIKRGDAKAQAEKEAREEIIVPAADVAVTRKVKKKRPKKKH